jgi:hypothetical protein
MNSSENFGSDEGRKSSLLVIEVITFSIAIVVAMRNRWPLRHPAEELACF